MSTKRVILANDSRLLREMLHRAIDRADNLEVAQEIQNLEELSPAVERFNPAWVILSLPSKQNARAWMDARLAEHPSVRFVFLAPDNSSIKMKWQFSYEEDLSNLSLRDFIHILEQELQHT